MNNIQNIPQSIINKAINQAKSPFTIDVMPLTSIPTNRNHFIVSVINFRSGIKFVIDYTFTIKTAKMVKSQIIEKTYYC